MDVHTHTHTCMGRRREREGEEEGGVCLFAQFLTHTHTRPCNTDLSSTQKNCKCTIGMNTSYQCNHSASCTCISCTHTHKSSFQKLSYGRLHLHQLPDFTHSMYTRLRYLTATTANNKHSRYTHQYSFHLWAVKIFIALNWF